jgi:hypothetical protein
MGALNVKINILNLVILNNIVLQSK